jgi:hypothetical protein
MKSKDNNSRNHFIATTFSINEETYISQLTKKENGPVLFAASV